MKTSNFIVKAIGATGLIGIGMVWGIAATILTATEDSPHGEDMRKQLEDITMKRSEITQESLKDIANTFTEEAEKILKKFREKCDSLYEEIKQSYDYDKENVTHKHEDDCADSYCEHKG